MARWTFSTVTERTPGREFSTRSTVARLTPATRAMSLTVGLSDVFSSAGSKTASHPRLFREPFEQQGDGFCARIVVAPQVFLRNVSRPAGLGAVDRGGA